MTKSIAAATLVGLCVVGLTARSQEAGSKSASAANPKAPANPRLEALKKEAAADIDSRAVFIQQMVDQVFSFGELGFQEFETSKYLTGILEKNGFSIQRELSGVPTAWMATWGSGKP